MIPVHLMTPVKKRPNEPVLVRFQRADMNFQVRRPAPGGLAKTPAPPFDDHHGSRGVVPDSLAEAAQEHDDQPQRIDPGDHVHRAQDVADRGFQPSDGLTVGPDHAEPLEALSRGLSVPQGLEQEKISQVHHSVCQDSQRQDP